MFRNRKSSRRKGAGAVPLEYQGSLNESHNILPSTSKISNPMNDIQFQPSEMCPQNFLIFDETESSSRVMFHPGITNNSSYPHLNFHGPLTGEWTSNYMNNFEPDISSTHVEDSSYIDMLLSLDEDDQGESQEDQEEDETSTARTRGYDDGNSSPESCSNYGSKSRKLTYPLSKKSKNGGSSSHPNNKRKEARKMVQVLRGMLPGGDHMNTASVFDATVQHLKGLEEKVQRLGLNNPNRFRDS